MKILDHTYELCSDALHTSASPEDPLALITHPERALDAARRMAVSCRSGLRFYSDFRRVRSLDDIPEGEAGDDSFEVFDDLGQTGSTGFDPAFSRRV